MDIPTHKDMVQSITTKWHSASADDLAAGLRWYADAHTVAQSLAAGTRGRVSVEQAAGVIAALSPRLHWVRTLRAAAQVIDGKHPSGVFTRQLDTAQAILAGRQSGPTGPKVSAFHRAIMGDETAIVVDVWASRAAGIDTQRTLSKAQYHRIANAYREAAERLGIAPRSLQAATWVATRGKGW